MLGPFAADCFCPISDHVARRGARKVGFNMPNGKKSSGSLLKMHSVGLFWARWKTEKCTQVEIRTSSLVAAIAATSSLVLSLRHGFCRHEATADSLRAHELRMPKHNTRSGPFGNLLNESDMISDRA